MGIPYRTGSQQYALYEAALDIQAPWEIKEVRLDRERQRLDINLDFQRGALFSCSECHRALVAYDTHMREWLHLALTIACRMYLDKSHKLTALITSCLVI